MQRPDMNYGGQTVRLLLVDSLVRLLKTTGGTAGAAPVTAAQLNALFDNSNELWKEIATDKKISDKVSGLLDPNFVAQIRAWFDTVEVRSAIHAGSADAVTTADGIYRFEMPHPIPTYLIALAVGRLEFKSIDSRTGVYAEPELLADGAWDLQYLPAMMAAAERIMGPYPFERYDVLL